MDLTRFRHGASAKISSANQKIKLRLTEPASWKLPKQHSSIAPPDVWTNADQDPVPPEKQTWTEVTFLTYWFSDLVTISGWSAAGSILTTGLSATDAIIITLMAGICNAIPTVLNGAIGADLHVPFPIAVRASYGYWLSYFCVISRAVLAMFWFGVQSVGGGQCVSAMITAIWPSYQNIENTLPESIGITSQGMVSYFIYWLIQTPLLLIPTHRLQYLFNAKAILMTPMALAMVIWISCKARGQSSNFFYAPATVSGSTRAWLWLANLTSVTGGYTTLTVNIPDFSRFSKNRGANLWQLPAIPFFKVIVGIFGIISAGASKEVYGEALWNPIDIINKWQGSAGGRAAAFFCAFIWLLAQISVNISANGISFANDITTMAPKYLNIRRGAIIVSFLGGWVLCPWIIMASAQAFMSFMSAYAIFMAPIAGILTTDYWLVKGRKYDVPALYDPHGIYRFGWGGNWRALITTVVIITPLLPALGHKVTPNKVPIPVGLQHLFDFNWIYGFVTSIVLYYGLNLLFPHSQTLISQVVHGDHLSIDGILPDIEASKTGSNSEVNKTGFTTSLAKET
ncbi:permease for cytosine/purines, uracil, thiamine, allantoin-domain-containing protein [Dactylonectria estremocensis]|uniref:Permease for cytosine/purines, uracil, thiamine, allantoin-domain-containing protein n=1 Tax=Dactylonectria estremocensis TaxID=1079267 RepID=A0A9P9DMH0_9HYPO|nr:permease for cytosine/purines, uracil, thiamine, allantoin-domain-containing protein [Dactylonectria estremocensis]